MYTNYKELLKLPSSSLYMILNAAIAASERGEPGAARMSRRVQRALTRVVLVERQHARVLQRLVELGVRDTKGLTSNAMTDIGCRLGRALAERNSKEFAQLDHEIRYWNSMIVWCSHY